MRFIFIDRINSFEKGASLKGVKTLSLAEEYLKDHFPSKPILPGVLMLEALVQAGAWLVRLTNDYQHSMITLVQAKTIRYGKFVSPGDRLDVEVEWKKAEGEFVELIAKGTVDGEQAVSAKLKLKQQNLVDLDPKLEQQDQKLKDFYKNLFQQIHSQKNKVATAI